MLTRLIGITLTTIVFSSQMTLAFGGARSDRAEKTAWEKLGKERQQLYKKMVTSDGKGTDVSGYFRSDLRKFQDTQSSDFSCQFPYRAFLFQEANLGQFKPCPIKPRLNVRSNDMAMIGQSQFPVVLDPRRIKRVFVNNDRFKGDHSFITLEVCERAPANCEKPFSIAIHYGKRLDLGGKVGDTWATPLSDLASTTKFQVAREIQRVEVACDSGCKQKLVVALYEKANHSPDYSLVRRNCANFVLDVVQLSTGFQKQPWFYVTPKNVLEYAEKQSGNKLQTLGTFYGNAKMLMRAIHKNDKMFRPTDFDEYAKLAPSFRYCSTMIRSGGIKGFINQQYPSNDEEQFETISRHLNRGGECSSEISKTCQRLRKRAAIALNQITKCAVLEVHVLLSYKTDLTHKYIMWIQGRKPEISKEESDYFKDIKEMDDQVTLPALEETRDLLRQIVYASEIVNPFDEAPTADEKDIQAYEDKVGVKRREMKKKYDALLLKKSGVKDPSTFFDYFKARAEHELARCSKVPCPKKCG